MGQMISYQSFEGYGKRRDAQDWTGSQSAADDVAIANTGRRGYTRHTMLDNLSLVHMNGRVFDPTIGRFMSPDPYIDGEDAPQGWNRYSYVVNGPLSATDPTGYRTCSGPDGQFCLDVCLLCQVSTLREGLAPIWSSVQSTSLAQQAQAVSVSIRQAASNANGAFRNIRDAAAESDFVDRAAGFGDTVWFGLPTILRAYADIGSVDSNSPAYRHAAGVTDGAVFLAMGPMAIVKVGGASGRASSTCSGAADLHSRSG
jgi:RHS repeat-associated protein